MVEFILNWRALHSMTETDIYVMMNGSVNGLRYRNEILAPFVVS